MKASQYFLEVRRRPDRCGIQLEWIERVVKTPDAEVVQADGRSRQEDNES